MKIIKKAKLPRVKCGLCGCVFVPHKDDLHYKFLGSGAYVDDTEKISANVYVNCPTCGLSKLVFEKGENK